MNKTFRITQKVALDEIKMNKKEITTNLASKRDFQNLLSFFFLDRISESFKWLRIHLIVIYACMRFGK